MAAEGCSFLLFRHLFVIFFKRRKRRKRKPKGSAPLFLRFSFFLFIFLKSKRKSKEQRKSSLLFPILFSFSFRAPGVFVCVSGDFVPSSARKGARGLFSEGRGEPKEGIDGGIRLSAFSPLFHLLFQGERKGKKRVASRGVFDSN